MAYTMEYRWSPNYSMEYNGLKGIVIHHAASTSFESIGEVFSRPERQASAHYGVAPGRVAQYVHEKDRAWHAGDTWANGNTIGIETLNSTGEGGGWQISEDTIDTLVELCRDIAERNNMLPLVVGKNLFGHKDFSATFCPGVLYGRLEEIADRVNNFDGGFDMDTKQKIDAIYTAIFSDDDASGRGVPCTPLDRIDWNAKLGREIQGSIKAQNDVMKADHELLEKILKALNA